MIGKRAASYYGMPEQRRCRFKFQCARPSELRVDDRSIPDWRYDAEKAVLIIPPVAALKDKTMDVCLEF